MLTDVSQTLTYPSAVSQLQEPNSLPVASEFNGFFYHTDRLQHTDVCPRFCLLTTVMISGAEAAEVDRTVCRSECVHSGPPAVWLTSQLSADIRPMSCQETQTSGADESVCRHFYYTLICCVCVCAENSLLKWICVWAPLS